MPRSIAAVLAGFILIGALSVGADLLLRQAVPTAFGPAGRVDSVPILLLMMGYVGVFAVGGCYLAARLAPSRPMIHALVLGALGLLFTGYNTIVVFWDTAPAWFHVASLLLVMPYAWLGGRLREVEAERAGAAVHAPRPA
jgi:hypothetical protein